MANAGCINAIWFDWTYLRTLDTLDSANIGVGVQYCIPAPLDDKRLDYIKYTDKCGCTCCITGENEILVYATNWVIKNFTLTNDDDNEVVNVKWTDLFWSNWKKTIVRYKTWSYPTNISDWTLAVQETIQNQYSVNWYNVSWLADWTTYYFTAFAVDSNNNVIASQNKTVTTNFFRAKYQAVEYIYSSTYWPMIDTWFTPNTNSKMQFKVMPLWTFGWSIIWAYYSGIVDTQDHRVFNYQNQIYYDLPWGSWSWNRIYWGAFNANTIYEFEAWNYYVKNVWASSNLVSWNAVSFTAVTTIKLNDSIWAYSRWYYVKIFDNWTLVRDLKPYKRKSDNVPLMIDILSKTVYTNAWTWSFIAWPNV